jgi:hypothetical protein
MSVLNEAIIFLIAAVIAVLLSRRFGLVPFWVIWSRVS